MDVTDKASTFKRVSFDKKVVHYSDKIVIEQLSWFPKY